MASDEKLKRLQRNSQKTIDTLERLLDSLHHQPPDTNHVSWLEKLIQWIAVVHFQGLLPDACQHTVRTLFHTFLTLPVTFLEEWRALFDCIDLALYRLKSLGWSYQEAFWRTWMGLTGRVYKARGEEVSGQLLRPVFITCSIIIHLHGAEKLFELCNTRADGEALWSNPCFVELVMRCVVRAVLCLPHHAFPAHQTAIFFIKYALLSSVSLLRRAGLEGLKALYLAKSGCDDIVELNGSIRRLLSLSHADDGRRAYDAVLSRIKREQAPEVDSHTQILYFFLDIRHDGSAYPEEAVTSDVAWVKAADDQYLRHCVRDATYWTKKDTAQVHNDLHMLAAGDRSPNFLKSLQSESVISPKQAAVPKIKHPSNGSLSTFVVDEHEPLNQPAHGINKLTDWAEKPLHDSDGEGEPVACTTAGSGKEFHVNEMALEHVLKMPSFPAQTARLLRRSNTSDVALPSILYVAKNALQGQTKAKEPKPSAPLRPFPLPASDRSSPEKLSHRCDEKIAVRKITPEFQHSAPRKQISKDSLSHSIPTDRSPIESSEVATVSEILPVHVPVHSEKEMRNLNGRMQNHVDQTENGTLDNLSTDQSFLCNEPVLNTTVTKSKPEKRLITKKRMSTQLPCDPMSFESAPPKASAKLKPEAKNRSKNTNGQRRGHGDLTDSPSVTEASLGKKTEEVRMDLQVLLDRMQRGPRYSKDVVQAVEEFVQLTRCYPHVVESAIGAAFAQFLPLVYSLNSHVAAEAVAALETVMPLVEGKLHLVASQVLEALCSNMQNARTCDHSKKVFNQILNTQIERAGTLLAPLAANITIMMKKNKKDAFAFVTGRYAEALKYAFPKPPKSQAAAVQILQFVKSVLVWITNYGDLHSSSKPEIVAVDALIQQAIRSFGLEMVNKVCYDYRDTIKLFLSRNAGGVPVVTASGPGLRKVVVRKSSLMAFKKQARF
ncbi:uncharacterized protein LOC129590455 [Paramacrobiotus metropolitanus]|uniref:uncharacterized protein LOC129590455 n=1 Tax=Paramacrobiotus metropolitanus TaxID=2943436 RepID=UPI002446568A|nr:uncharacterized protein LOC129590455 [Paramacrobiotus metropolitanus]